MHRRFFVETPVLLSATTQLHLPSSGDPPTQNVGQNHITRLRYFNVEVRLHNCFQIVLPDHRKGKQFHQFSPSQRYSDAIVSGKNSLVYVLKTYSQLKGTPFQAMRLRTFSHPYQKPPWAAGRRMINQDIFFFNTSSIL